jgi:leucyl aminopeptidase
LGEAAGLEVEVLNDKDLAKDGYGGVIGVGQGSSRPPRLVRLIHRGAKNKVRTRGAKTGKAKKVAWSARASRSTPVASPSSRPRTCTT